jgi:hypothetical protein
METLRSCYYSALLSQPLATGSTLSQAKWKISSYLTLTNCYFIRLLKSICRLFRLVSDMTSQCKGKWTQMFTHLCGDQSCRRTEGGNVRLCLQRVRMCILYLRSAQMCISEGSNVAICVPVELFCVNCNTNCWLTIKSSHCRICPSGSLATSHT